MIHSSVFATFKIEYEAYLVVKGEDGSKVPKMNARENYRNIIRWSLIFRDYLPNSYGSRGLFSCFLREETTFPDKVKDPLLTS